MMVVGAPAGAEHRRRHLGLPHRAQGLSRPTRPGSVNTLVASQDPVALDYWAAKHVLYPIDGNPRHHPDTANIQRWLQAAEQTINERGGLYHPEWGIAVGPGHPRRSPGCRSFRPRPAPPDSLTLTSPNGGESWKRGLHPDHHLEFQRRSRHPGEDPASQRRDHEADPEPGRRLWRAVPSSWQHARRPGRRATTTESASFRGRYPALQDTSDRPFSISHGSGRGRC